MDDYEEASENQVKHLEMIQAVIARLGSNGFVIKGWAVTVAGAFLAFAVNRNKWDLATAGVVPTLLFWMLDASFLRSERLFRDLFDRVRMGIEAPFYMGATAPEYVKRIKLEAAEKKRDENISSRFRTFLREALVLFYGAILLTCLITAAIICN
jgi:hypothetical protein